MPTGTHLSTYIYNRFSLMILFEYKNFVFNHSCSTSKALIPQIRAKKYNLDGVWDCFLIKACKSQRKILKCIKTIL